MKNNVREFPPPANSQAQVQADQSTVLFSLEGRRFAVQWIVTELCAEPAEVIPIKKTSQKKKGQRSDQT